MKSILAALVLSLGMSFATADNGGEGLTGPGDHYNPEMKCSVRDGLTLYITAANDLKVSATSYNSKANKVFNEYLTVRSAGANIYTAQMSNGEVFYIQFSQSSVTATDAHGKVTTCEYVDIGGGSPGNFP